MIRIVTAAMVLALASATRAEPPVKVATVEGVTKYRYPNGARLLLYPEPSRPAVTD